MPTDMTPSEAYAVLASRVSTTINAAGNPITTLLGTGPTNNFFKELQKLLDDLKKKYEDKDTRTGRFDITGIGGTLSGAEFTQVCQQDKNHCLLITALESILPSIKPDHEESHMLRNILLIAGGGALTLMAAYCCYKKCKRSGYASVAPMAPVAPVENEVTSLEAKVKSLQDGIENLARNVEGLFHTLLGQPEPAPTDIEAVAAAVAASGQSL